MITSGYLPNGKVPTSSTIMQTSYTHGAYWKEEPSFQTGWSTSKNRFFATAYNLDSHNLNANAKCVSTLLNTNNWSAFVTNAISGTYDVSGGFAIGSPTLEMWIKSWNEKYPRDKIYCDNTNEYGYYIGKTPIPTSTYIDQMNLLDGYTDKLYYPYTNVVDNMFGYWFASPSALRANMVVRLGCGGHIGDAVHSTYDFSLQNCALRPVVCLPAAMNAVKGADGKWTFYK